MMRFDVRKAVAVLAAVAMMGVAGPVAVSAANAADAPAAAQTAAQQVTVKFLDKDGKGFATKQAEQGSDFSAFTKQLDKLPEAPADNVFLYWTKLGGDNSEFKGVVDSDVTVFPVFTPAPAAKEVTVKFTDGRGTEITSVAKDEGTAFSEFAEGVKAPASEGNEFKGWTIDGLSTVAGDWKVTKDTEVVPLYVAAPTPSVEQVTLTFHGKDGQPGWPVKVTLDKNSPFSEFAKGLDSYALPSLPGYTLKGWSYKDNGPVFEGYVTMGSSIDVFPVFEKNPVEKVTVTFHGRDGQPGWPVVVTLDKGSHFSEFTKKLDGYTLPSMDGYTLKGWKAEGGSLTIGADWKIDSSFNALPVFEKNPVEKTVVVFNTQGGILLGDVEGQPGDLFGSFKAPDVTDITPAGQVFAGWTLKDGTLVSADTPVEGYLYVYASFKDAPKPQPQFPWWGNWWNAFQHWWGSWTQWGHGWWW